MKIYIIYQTKDVPSGGGNQFLKALSVAFSTMGVLATNPIEADAFLFNSHHCLDEVLLLKRDYPSKPFFHRIDGPMKLYNTLDDRRDDQTYWINEKIAEGTIFQSEWSRLRNLEAGMQLSNPSTVIFNAPNKDIFNKNSTKKNLVGPIPHLIATSWSDNMKKGFDVYRFIDEHYVGRQFNMTFVGRSPIPFKNIVFLPPATSSELADELRKCDVFITASQADPCSNSLIEALHCGLPAIVKNDGGHPELLGKAGFVFDHPQEIPDLVSRIAQNYSFFQEVIALPDIENVAGLYFDFMRSITKQVKIHGSKTITSQDLSERKKQRKKKRFWQRFIKS